MAGPPKPIAHVLAELMARRGYGRVQAVAALAETWSAAAGETLAARTRAGRLRQGVLEVWCLNSVLVQELAFQKQALLRKLEELAPRQRISDLRFRVGPID